MPKKPLKIHVLVLRDSTALVPVGIADLMRKAHDLARATGMRNLRDIELALVSPDAALDVPCAGGLALHCATRIARVDRSDLVVVPALDPEIEPRLAVHADAIRWVRELHARGADVASACTGAFVLGEAGVLDGLHATTHWAFQPLFAARYPRVQLQPHAILVDQGRVITAGGATSFLNLALYLIERVFGADLARAASKMFLVDVNKAPQSAYAMFATQKLHHDREILRAQQVIEEQPARVPSIERLAKSVAMSPRTFARRFRSATGNSPIEYVQRVRIEAAKRALESGERVGSVAGRVGYGDATSFRRLFARLVGLSPADYRERYGPSAAPATVIARRP